MSDKFCCSNCEELYGEEPDDSYGSVDEAGWYGLYKKGDHNPPTIMKEDSQGFVFCDEYENDEIAEAQFDIDRDYYYSSDGDSE